MNRTTKRAKKYIVALPTALLIGLVVSPSEADDDEFGESALKCFHPKDRHVDTSCAVTADKSEVDAAAERCSGQSITLIRCTTSYRGGWTSASYSMSTELKGKFTCTTERDGTKTRKNWVKLINVRDSKPPEPCAQESWRVMSTSHLGKPAASPSQGGCGKDYRACVFKCIESTDGDLDEVGACGKRCDASLSRCCASEGRSVDPDKGTCR